MKLTPKGCQTSPGFEPNGDRGALTDSDPNAYLDEMEEVLDPQHLLPPYK